MRYAASVASTSSTRSASALLLGGLALVCVGALAWYALGRPADASALAKDTAAPKASSRDSSSEPQARTSDPAGYAGLDGADAADSSPPPAPQKPVRALSARQRELADELGRLLDNEESTRAFVERNFERGGVHDWLDESLEFLRPRIGACDQPDPIVVQGPQRARLLYPCERGSVEATLILEQGGGKLEGILFGGRDIEPNPAVTEAAQLVLALIIHWDRERFLAGFTEAFDEGETRDFFASVRGERGRCVLDGIDLASAQGALWFIECDSGPALLKVSLDDDDRIHTLLIRARRKVRPGP
ncbi:hypothetical protein PPSIR1_12118 [Plesiocystis pacifica SIR-1]|uniref:Uncharacterized protein n=1 Tax=Plesiocystis pacifica SIR-1 TaxID=391625 RepID=A6G5V3_9BACT|nr:hypothetical protein PPSIR1_12118 [Plesiocystis pacifica SIR-1]